MSLAGRVALVTGGRRGIGQAIALRLAHAGAAVGIVALHDDAAVLAEIASYGVAGIAVAADLSVAEQARRAVAEVRAALGPVTILVKAAPMGWIQTGDCIHGTNRT